MRLKFYLFGAVITGMGVLAFKLSDLDQSYIKLSNKLSPAEMQIKDRKKFKKYLKFRQSFLLMTGLAIVILSTMIPD